MIDRQREKINVKINEIAKNSMIVYQGLKRERSESSSSTSKGRKSLTASKRRKLGSSTGSSGYVGRRIPIEKIPGIDKSMYKLLKVRPEQRKEEIDTFVESLIKTKEYFTNVI